MSLRSTQPAPLEDFPPEPLATAAGHVRPEWLDHNGHMNVAYYLMIFDGATDVFLALLGKNADYIARTRCSTFALEMHLTYDRELRLGEPYAVRTRLVDADHKRVHLLHTMHHGEQGWLAASNESINMHIDLEARRSAPFAPHIQDRIERLRAAHAALPDDEHIGRRIGIRRKAS